jgi:LmbE family N-acetylglucosaminyl deacetylase
MRLNTADGRTRHYDHHAGTAVSNAAYRTLAQEGTNTMHNTTEGRADAFLDGRKDPRVNRPVQVGLKISPEKRRQFDRLRLMTRWSYTDIFEAALDTFEEAWTTRQLSQAAAAPNFAEESHRPSLATTPAVWVADASGALRLAPETHARSGAGGNRRKRRDEGDHSGAATS